MRVSSLGLLELHGYVGRKGRKNAWEEAHLNWRRSTHFFPPCVVFGKAIFQENARLKLGGFAAMAAASLTERTSAKQREMAAVRVNTGKHHKKGKNG